MAENRPGGKEGQGENAASQLQELLPTLAVGWVQEEGLCRADQSVPPAGVGWRACHIVYQECGAVAGGVCSAVNETLCAPTTEEKVDINLETITEKKCADITEQKCAPVEPGLARAAAHPWHFLCFPP